MHRKALVLVGGHLPEATAVRFSMLAARERRTRQDLLEEALADLFVKYGAP